ncbi:ABC transporter ATP-binding protein [Thermospira aquatica]|uniref:ABC transporter ATP-binding protein n=1 Tax=Thermospira aquatica TaxID=2828656 RepID=A0AAX3BAP2_9SPIR|nr:ABC transporter ATP-binding protein [Thermospira aquatica]URA09343.1 ABC transporter ATP-binding protein [Thermospira aquatica]
MTLLAVENLVAGYKDKTVLRGVSFTVNEKEILGILGPNGSGKSTLVRALTGAIPASGKITYKEVPMYKFSRQKLACFMAVVSQSPPRPAMTVDHYLMLGRYPYHGVWDFGLTMDEKKLMRDLSKEFGIEYLLERKLSELSGGEFQLVQIVRALVQQPELLILDEPTAHLDIAHQVRILDWLERIKQQTTVMVVFHDMNLASLYCDRVMMLHEGLVEVIGEPAAALTYERIERVFGVPVVVYPSPMEQRPHVYLVPKRFLQRGEE